MQLWPEIGDYGDDDDDNVDDDDNHFLHYMSWTSYQTLPREEQIDQKNEGSEILNLQLWPGIGDYGGYDEDDHEDDDFCESFL